MSRVDQEREAIERARWSAKHTGTGAVLFMKVEGGAVVPVYVPGPVKFFADDELAELGRVIDNTAAVTDHRTKGQT